MRYVLVLVSLLAGAILSVPAPPALSLRINLPAYRLDLLQGDSIVRSYRIAIGGTAFETPTGNYLVTRVDWDPWWVPPASEWARGDTITPPGPQNPLGRVRLVFLSLYYLHGTPFPESVGTPSTHGCVRLANADVIDLAQRVLRTGAPAVPEADIRALARRRGPTRSIPLTTSVPLSIRYALGEVLDDTLMVYADVYRRVPVNAVGDSMIALLKRAAPERIIDTETLRHFLALPRRPLAIPLDAVSLADEALLASLLPAHGGRAHAD